MPRSKLKPESSGERLQKVLAAAGVGSRRECEQMILDGRVEVDRVVVKELGTRVDSETQKVRVDGEPLNLAKRVYYMINKPTGVVSTNRDPDGRMRVIDLIETDERLFTVGRLDKSSEGLILVTNDGELANRLTHPRYEVTKTYEVLVAGSPNRDDLESLRRGVRLAEGVARVMSVRSKKRVRNGTVLEIVLNEGRNREIRRLLALIGHKVLRLKRTAIGRVTLGALPQGTHRRLTADEVKSLRRAPKSPHSRSSRSKASRSKSTGSNGRGKKHGKAGRPVKRTTALSSNRKKKVKRKGRQ